MKERSTVETQRTVGLDVGDRWIQVCMLDQATGEEIEAGRVRTDATALERRFQGLRMRIALEVGAQSPWISRLLKRLGHEVLVANARHVALIYGNRRKNDRVDAEALARLARFDPKLLRAIEHRGEQAQVDRVLLRARDILVRSRSRLISYVRGTVKSLGSPLAQCSAESFAQRAQQELAEALQPSLGPVIEEIAALTAKIRVYDGRIEQLATECYPDSALLRQIDGVGSITSLAYMLKLENPRRFHRSRTVGAYLGLVPRCDQSGDHDPQLRITKQGDAFVRRLLIQCAHYQLGPFGKDCALRRYGLRIAERGGKNAKKRAAVAVARKLAGVLHHLWLTGEVYEPFPSSTQGSQKAA